MGSHLFGNVLNPSKRFNMLHTVCIPRSMPTGARTSCVELCGTNLCGLVRNACLLDAKLTRFGSKHRSYGNFPHHSSLLFQGLNSCDQRLREVGDGVFVLWRCKRDQALSPKQCAHSALEDGRMGGIIFTGP